LIPLARKKEAKVFKRNIFYFCGKNPIWSRTRTCSAAVIITTNNNIIIMAENLQKLRMLYFPNSTEKK